MYSRILAVLVLAATTVTAQKSPYAGKTVYIEKMEQDLDGYLRAEFVKKKVPLVIVLEPDNADLILTGSTTEEQKRKWHQGWLTAEQDRTTGNIMLIERNTKKMVWASEAGDRSLWWGALSRGGHRKVATRLATNLKKFLQK